MGCAPTAPAAVSTVKAVRAKKTAPVALAALPPVSLAATTTTAQRLELAFRTGGVVQTVAVVEGARVKRGQVLARLDPTELGAGVKQAEEGLDRARRGAERARVLAEGRAGNRSDAEDALTAVAVAEAQVDAARFARDRSVIVAPVDGRIERRLADPGEVTAPGQTVLVLAQSQARGATARAFVDDRSLRFIDVGSAVTATVDGVVKDGTVTRIGSAAGPLGQVELEMLFADVGRDLPTGVPLRVALITGQQALAVPALAVVDGDELGRGRIFAANDPARPLSVKILAVQGGTVFVDVKDPDVAAVTAVVLPSL